MPTVGPTLGTMLGLGVGIDYALFIVTRHRGFMEQGHPVDEAAARAVGDRRRGGRLRRAAPW